MKKPTTALLPPPYEVADVSALQAVAEGRANKDQQQRAMKWIVEVACQTYQPSYRNGPDGERDTVFAEGRRFVGVMIVEKLKLNTSVMRRSDEHRKEQAAEPGKRG